MASQTYSENISYTPWLGVTQTTGSNGETTITSYDLRGRPTAGVGPFGATFTYTYSGSGVIPVTQTQTTNASQA